MFLDVFTILPLICSIFVALLGLFVFFKDPRSRMHQLLFGFNVCMWFWLFGTFMMFATRGSADRAIFWDRFVYLGVIMMPSLMHHFSLVFTNNKNKQRILLFINYIIGISFLFASRTKYFVDGLNVYSWGAHSQARILHHIFLGYFFLSVGIFFTNLLRAYLKSKDHIFRVQTIYVFIAFAQVMFVGGSAYLYAYGIDTKFPFAYITGLIFPVMLFYAVTKHGLLGTKVIATEVVVGIAEFFVVMQIFFSDSPTQILESVLFALIIALVGFLFVQSVNREIVRRQEVTKLAQSLESANIRLQELDKQKTEFLSIASHQLRTPLSILKGYIELIKDGAYGKVGSQTVKALGDMDINNEHLVKLVDEFLDISRIEQGRAKYEFAAADICALIDSAMKDLKIKAEQKGLRIKWDCPKRISKVDCDQEKIHHVIFNFIDNAVKYSDKGIVKVMFNEEDEGMAVRVKDQGAGFEKKDEVNFFQKFYRGDNVKAAAVTGTGLGLYVCRKFIEAHNGRVWAHSAGPGKGSEFGFWLPLKHVV